MKTERFAGFDILKFICSFLVVCVYIPFPGVFGRYFTALVRIAVPVFFIITGFYYCDVRAKGMERKQLWKIFKLFIFSNLLFAVWKSILTVFNGDSVLGY